MSTIGRAETTETKTSGPPSRSSALGDFVHSSMMKRSDSVSKRWSAQASPRINRANSSASNRSAAHEQLHHVPLRSDSNRTSDSVNSDRPATPHAPNGLRRNGSESSTEIEPRPQTPTRTMDPKRWSPTKASWLESALNRPDTMRQKKPPPLQPSWMKERHVRGSTDLGATNTVHLRAGQEAGTDSASMPKKNKPTTSDDKTESAADKTKSISTGSDLAAKGREVNLNPQNTSPSGRIGKDVESHIRRDDIAAAEDKRHAPSIPPKPSISLSASTAKQRSPPSTTTKQHSPAMDLRSNLRRREIAKDDSQQEEPEFKNVFGKLRKAETKNYVPEDKFKENILRGKAALNVTGGPQKTQRVDEFKENILKQKEAMKASGGFLKRNQDEQNDMRPQPAIPEALAKRSNLSKSNNISSLSAIGTKPLSSKPSIQGTTASRATRELHTNGSRPVGSASGSALVGEHQNDDGKKTDVVIKPARSLPLGNVTRVPPVAGTNENALKGKLAGRINPALATFLSRGAPSAAGGAGDSSALTGPPKEDAGPIHHSSETHQTPTHLTHMTKHRARGPKRRLPKSASPSSPAPHPQKSAVESSISKPSKPTPSPLPIRKSSLRRPPSPTFSPSSLMNLKESKATSAYTSPATPVSPRVAASPRETPGHGLEKETGASRMQRPIHSASVPMNLRDSKATSASTSPATSASPREMPGHGLEKETSAQRMHRPTHSPPVPQKKSSLSLKGVPSVHLPKPPVKSPPVSPIPRTTEASHVICDFFKTKPKSSDRVEIDPQLVLESEPEDVSVRTVKRHIWEITGDGKMQDLPPDREYILYEGSMYLCIHTFTSDGSSSSRSEAYLWHGDDVGEAALQDAQLFARKTARDYGGKLELIQQGKEGERFIQALGGIIVTRHGTSSRTNSSALYMLCGRKHLKQVVFDEVDYSCRELCSGYPFVISAKFGKVFMWKGQGSGAEEIGAARLIGMDLGLTGDFEEVTEGEEPHGFFENFPDYKEARQHVENSDYWRLKARHPLYHQRLLRIDHELGRSSGFWIRKDSSHPNDKVQIIEPFCSKDITPRDIYVLDAFFEVYV